MSLEDEQPADSVVRHWLPHPAMRVYAALLDPAVLTRWYGPDGLHVEPGSVHVEPHEGGTWRLVLAADAGGARVLVDRTLVRLQPGRLVLAEEPDPDGAADPLAWRVDLAAHVDGTTVEVREGPLPAAEVALSGQGWSQALARLEQVLAAGA